MDKDVVAVAFWITAGVCAFAVIYPYAIYPLVLLGFRKRPINSERRATTDGGEFALLFCAFNEERSLPEKLANLRTLRDKYPALEILVYDDFSSDRTAKLLEGTDIRIRLVRGGARAGKAHGMKVLAALTEREYLVFTDANVELHPESLHHLLSAYSDATVGGVCGVLQCIDGDGTPTAHAGGMYWRLEEKLKSLESQSGNVMGGDGSIFSVRRCLYPDFPDTVLDDMTVSMAVVFNGYRLIKDDRVIARERLVASQNDDYRRRVRIAMRCFHTHIWFRSQLRRMSPGDRWRWWSHRYLRWNGAFFLVAGFASGIAALLVSDQWKLAFALVVAAGTLGFLGIKFRLGPLSTLVHLVSSILVTGMGVLKAWRGQTMATWKPPAR